MPDAIITSTASTFGTISGTFAADQSTIVGTVAGSVVGNLLGSVGVPGPAGPGVPAGGTAGQYLQKIDGVDYNTDWVTLNLSAYAPLNSPAFTGNPTAPTAALGDNDTSIATTAFVQQELASGTAVAKNLEVYVRNQTGSTLAAGTIVYINGATGNRPTVTPAQANNDANSAQTMGFVKTAIANNGFGFVIVRGELENIDTQALTEGVQLYLSPTTPGAWTTTKPSAPQHLVYVGIVVRAHPTQGVILVAVQNGYELNELHDVAISSPTNGQVLKYDSATNLWKNQTDSSGVAWGGITGTLSSQTDLQTALDAKLETSTAASTYAALAGATFTGLVGTVASTTTTAGLNIPHGTAPTTPVNGDVWTTTGGLFWRQNGSTQQAVEIGSTQTISGNKTFSNANVSLGTSTAAGTINVGTGATISGSTKAINIGTDGVSGSTTNITLGSAVSGALGTTTVNGNITATGTTLTLGNSTAASTINVGTGATLSGSTKTINIGTNGVLGSTNIINIGPTATSGNINFNNNSVALGSNSTATTAAADTNSTALATTAFVVGQAGSATPLVNGTAAVGTSLRYARQDHVHPTDTSRAALASPTFTGTPAAPTAAADTNTTQIATTAFVVGQAGSATPLVNGTAAVGTSLRYARQDHVHPTDTTRAPLASPAFTGTPSLPTGTTAVTQSAGNNTTAVATTAFVQQEVPAASTTAAGKVELATRVEVIEPTSNTLAVTPFQAIDVLMHPGYVQIAQNNGNVTTATSGAGAGIFTTSMTRVCIGPNTATAGSVYYRPQTNGGVAQFMARGNASVIINFSKKFWMSGRSWFDNTFIGDANNTARVTVGKSAIGAGALAQKGIGWQKAGGSTANFFLLAHNGTTLTSIDTNTSLSSLGISGGAAFDWSIYSDGAGNVTMWINDTQVATTGAGPTGNSLGSCVWQEEVDQTASAATRMYFTNFSGHYYHV